MATRDYGLNAPPEGYYKSVFISHKKQDLAEASEGILPLMDPCLKLVGPAHFAILKH